MRSAEARACSSLAAVLCAMFLAVPGFGANGRSDNPASGGKASADRGEVTGRLKPATPNPFELSGGAPEDEARRLEITRAARPWEFLDAVGKRAGIFGNEAGRVEAWVYPLKIFRDFHLIVHTEGRAIPAETLVRTVEARPEATTLVYSGDTFRILETFFVPVNEPGAVIELQVETEKPLEIEAAFRGDFALEWPAGLGGTYVNWDEKLNAFAFGEESKRFAALVGSPTAAEPMLEYQTNYSETEENSLRLGVTQKGSETKLIAIAANVHGEEDAEAEYEKLISDYGELQKEASEYYAGYLQKTVSVEFPDAKLQKAYDWSRISLAQGIVTNPTMGTGLVAGYRTSGSSQRPGFAWFFGRDSFWSSFALDSEGDFATTKMALEFIQQFQRADGKMPHEIAQGASYVNWFKDYPYGYASADSTPLYIIAMNEYVKESGDVEFARNNWDKLQKAYEFLRSTYDANGLPKNLGVGTGWVEGGPLLPVETEIYQAGLAVDALRSLANLAELTGKDAESKELVTEYEKERPRLDEAFWSAKKKIYAFGLDLRNKRVEEASVLATVPMWFGLLDETKSEEMIETLAGADQETDWGMRIISDESPKYSGGGYHFGSVWPLFTGWASVGEYRYHRAQPAYENLRANALLALEGSPGHVTEVLSGDYFQPLSTASPHQIWSAAMVISPILRGMLGLEYNAEKKTLTFAPHVPADWTSLGVEHVAAGDDTLNLRFSRSADEVILTAERKGTEDCTVNFGPAVSLRADVVSAELNGRPVAFRVEKNAEDQHVIVKFGVYGGPNTLRIRLRNDFAVSYTAALPELGSASVGLRIQSESWNDARDRLNLEIEGVAGQNYELSVWNGTQLLSAEGAEILKTPGGATKLRISLASEQGSTLVKQAVVLHLVAKTARVKTRKS
jgi:glycogen debranching enzyme